MKITFDATKIVVLQGRGTDQIFFHTTLPLGLWPFHDTGASFRIEVAAKTGPNYVETNFGISPNDIEIIQMSGIY